MKTIVMNMIRIFKNNEVLVLDKVKKHGWEGLTFPGGKVEPDETMIEAAIREAKEETNLEVSNLKFNGFIIWYDRDNDERLFGLLYTAYSFSGSLVEHNVEGDLFFMDYDEFMSLEGKSDSMDDILSIYNGEFSEIVLYYENNQLVDRKRISNE